MFPSARPSFSWPKYHAKYWAARYVTTAYLLLTLFSTEKAPLAYPTFVTVVLQEEAAGFVLSENNSSRNEVTEYADVSK